jgi:putative phosphonate metabolism protein
MLEEAPRYAVYYVPAADSDLYRFGSAILEYDCYTGKDLPPPDHMGIDPACWRKLTDEPRRYGFHATLKAPFRLAPSRTEAEMANALSDFASLAQPIARITPDVRILGGFMAIVPREPSPALTALADRCTMAFDGFRAPMSAGERDRRIASGLSESQIRNLDRWGYPYLFDDFRFHMTLTGKVPVELRDDVLAVLRLSFDRMCGDGPIAVDQLGLVKQDNAQGRFRVLSTVTLKGAD